MTYGLCVAFVRYLLAVQFLVQIMLSGRGPDTGHCLACGIYYVHYPKQWIWRCYTSSPSEQMHLLPTPVDCVATGKILTYCKSHFGGQ